MSGRTFAQKTMGKAHHIYGDGSCIPVYSPDRDHIPVCAYPVE